MTRTKIAAAILAAITAAAMISGCARLFARHSAPASNSALFAVAAEKTSFYRYGPQQGQGPDRQLSRDTLVRMIRRSFGYSKVRLEDGQQGFVANDDLVRAPARLIAQVNDSASEDVSPLPPTPAVTLPISDTSPEFEPTPLPEPLMPPQ